MTTPMLYKGSKFDTHTNQFLHISSFLFFLRIFIDISVRPRPHVAGYFRKRIIFFSEYGYHPHEASVFGDRKRRFSNALSRVEIFENGNLSYSCARRIRRVLNTMTSCLGSRLALPHIRFENATSMDAFILKYGGKKYPFSKIPSYVWTGSKYRFEERDIQDGVEAFLSLAVDEMSSCRHLGM